MSDDLHASRLIKHRFWTSLVGEGCEVYLEKLVSLPAFIPNGIDISLSGYCGGGMYVSGIEYGIDSGIVSVCVETRERDASDILDFIFSALAEGWSLTDWYSFANDLDLDAAVTDESVQSFNECRKLMSSGVLSRAEAFRLSGWGATMAHQHCAYYGPRDPHLENVACD